MSQNFDVCIRGSGIVGSTLALLLAQQRLRVALVSPAGQPSPPGPDGHADVRAYALNSASRQLLTSLRVWPEADTQPPAVTPVTRMEVQGDHGGALAFDATQVNADALNWIVDVPALERRLADALRYQGQVERFTTDQPLPDTALTVVCEGRRSATRAEWGLDYRVNTYPHHALAARLDLGRPHGGVARQWFSGQDIVAWLPLGGPAGTQVALVWSTTLERVRHVLTLDADAFLSALQPLCGAGPHTLTLTHPPQSWPLELSQASPWVSPGLALAGDAAHAMHPLAGQGLNVGLGDAAELAKVLQEREYWRHIGDLRLLRRYERARKAAFAAMGGVTDGLFTLFNTATPSVQNLRNWGLTGVDRLTPLKRWLAQQAMG